MTTPNLFFAEPHIVEALRVGVPALKSVGTWGELPESITEMGATPAAYVIFEGTGKAENSGGGSITQQFWTVAIAMNLGQTKAGADEKRALVGELLAQADAMCHGLKLPKSFPLELYDGPGVRYYKGGQAVFYLTYALTSPLLR